NNSIGICPSCDRTMIGITNRKLLGHGILKGNFLSGIIGNRKGGLEKWPISIFTLVPRCLCIWKIVRCTGNKSRIAYFAICPVRRNNPFSVRLVEYPLSTLQWNGKTVAKSPHPFHGAKIMIKGSVLLHQDHNVLNVLNRSAHIVCRHCQSLLQKRLPNRCC